jgi:hypothetical protein
MVVLYVRGARVGTVEQDPHLLARLIESGVPVEFRTDSGRNLAKLVPETSSPEPVCQWEPDLTEKEIARRVREGGTSLAEFWRGMGVR